jgi:hypothetical protein
MSKSDQSSINLFFFIDFNALSNLNYYKSYNYIILIQSYLYYSKILFQTKYYIQLYIYNKKRTLSM